MEYTDDLVAEIARKYNDIERIDQEIISAKVEEVSPTIKEVLGLTVTKNSKEVVSQHQGTIREYIKFMKEKTGERTQRLLRVPYFESLLEGLLR